MSCLRHSYPRGTKPGDGRKCRKCQYLDNGTPSTRADFDDPISDLRENPAGSSQTPSMGTELPRSSEHHNVDELIANLPVAHSPLGASSAERWMNCPGSVTLIEMLQLSGTVEEDDPDYRRDGVQAHALAAKCLNEGIDAWEAMGTEFPDLDVEMMSAVQVYLDFCHTLPGRVTHIEHRMHRPEFHRLAFGTGDFISVHCVEAVVDFVDYKHGVGMVVDPEANVQLMYYGYLLIGEDRGEYPDETVMRVHIVQPRADNFRGPIRSWITTAGMIRQWAGAELRPAMERVEHDRYLSMGEHCRFCPAKLVCPAMRSLGNEVLHEVAADPTEWAKQLSDEAVDEWYAKVTFFEMGAKAIRDEAERRVLNGAVFRNAKAVNKKSWRVFKEGVPIRETFGDDGFTPKSVAEIEKLTGGKEFVTEWGFNRNSGLLTIAPTSDKRAAQEIKSGAQTFQIAEGAE